MRKVYHLRTPEPRLPDAIVERVLARLGLAAPRPDAAGLAALYLAWCRGVPWDNVRKRISVVERRPVLAGIDPREFFASWLRDGTGGTCWTSSGALHALLVALDFDARRLVGTMDPARWPAGTLNHAGEVVRADGEEWLVDTSMLTEHPLPLRRRERTVIEDTLHPLEAEPLDAGGWLVTWEGYARPERIRCALRDERVPHETYLERYEWSRTNGFSYGLTFRRNLPDGVLSIQGTTRTYKDRTGAIDVRELTDRDRVLVDEGGLSPGIVAQLPADEPDGRPLGRASESSQ